MEGELVRGYICDLSHTGFFVETTAPLEAGHELEVRLVGGATPRPVYVRVVVDRRVPAEVCEPDDPPGIQFRLLRFSLAYARIIADDEVAERRDELAPLLAPSTEKEGERVWLSEVLGSKDRTPPSEPRQKSEEWDEYEPLPERAGVPLWSEASFAPEAIVIDDGELDDVVRILEELGVRTRRESHTGDSLPATWTPPQRLLVVTAKRALQLHLPLKSQRNSFASIVVADSDARMLYSELRRLGFQFAVSRPVHPLAMWMLLRQASFAGDERRVASRAILGASVHWWCGWGRKRPGVVLEASLGGCRLVVQHAVARGSRLKIRLPNRGARGAGLTVEGEVVRTSQENGGTTLGVRFEEISDDVRERLRGILASPGPCRLTEAPEWLAADLSVPDGVGTPGDGAPQEDGHTQRVTFQQDIVALEHHSNRVKHLLVSTDLTASGMQIEPHPSLTVGERLQLALYEDMEAGPLILSAEVARDDGPGGWWLQFVEITPEIERRIARMLDRPPQVACLTAPDTDSGRVVLGQVLVQDEAELEDELAG